MTEVYAPKKQAQEKGHERKDGMQGLAVKEEHHYTAPLPEAAPPPFHPFPARVMAGLGIGALVGGLLGLVFGQLLQQNRLVIPNWEGLYSMGPFTFVFFWVIVGLALGVMTIGVGILLSTPLERQPVVKEAIRDPSEHGMQGHNSTRND